MDLKKLKSGTDIRGVALGGYDAEVTLTDDNVTRIACAFAKLLKTRMPNSTRIAVGRDSRISGPRMMKAVTDALTSSGYDVLDCGLCSTPSMFMMTVYEQIRADASIMITASHHPAQANGLKFFFPSGGAGSRDIDEIIAIAQGGERISAETAGSVKTEDYMALYCGFLKDKIRSACGGTDLPLAGFHIVVDAGNGAGGFYADRVLAPLGADVGGSQFLDPDGNFPNHIPNPENRTAMEAISRCVTENQADLGVIFDTDVDRAAIVTADGQEINRNRLIALISAILLREQPGSTIVTDSVTSDGLREFIESRGGRHHRFKRGYRNVIDEAMRLDAAGENAPLAIETSGHAALKENFYLDDGAYLVTRLIIEAALLKRAGKTLTDLISDLRCAKEELEIRLSFRDGEDFRRVGAYIIEELKQIDLPELTVAPDNHEGVRISVPALHGWFLVRMSVHDPIIPINIESDTLGGAKKIAQLLYAYLKEYSSLNCENLLKSIG